MNFYILKTTGKFLSKILLISCLSLLCIFSNAFAKSLYVISSINQSPTPIQSYDILNENITYQTTYSVPYHGIGAVGITIDTDTNFLFVTYESSDVIQLIDGTTMTGAGSVNAPGSSNLAGIVIDQEKELVYTVDRNTANLYIYNWNTWSHTLTLNQQLSLSGISKAHGIALDESRGLLYIGDLTTTVKVFDTSDWSLSSTFNVSQPVMGIAVDTLHQIVYTGNAYGNYGSQGLLCKYDLTSSTETTQNIRTVTGFSSDNVLGLAVDKDSGIVYLTTGNQGSGGSDKLMVFDSDLNLLDSTGDIGDPTGVCVPGKDISFNPLMLTMYTALGSRPVGTDSDLTYHICFSNPTDGIVTGVELVDTIPAGATFVSATGTFIDDSINGRISWDFGNINPGDSHCVDITLHITAADGEQVKNSVTIYSDDYQPTTREDVKYVTNDPDNQQNIPIGPVPMLQVPGDPYKPWGTLYPYPSGSIFDVNKPTIVISHGWNVNPLNDDLPKWMAPMGDAIKNKANVFFWNWLEKASTKKYDIDIILNPNPITYLQYIPSENVPESGRQLGVAIIDMLDTYAGGASYDKEIQLIGFSLGAGVVVNAAAELNDSKYIDKLNQVTLLDGPLFLKGMRNVQTMLYKIDETRFVENYWSLVGMPVFYADTNIALYPYETLFWENHGMAHEWYRASMYNFDKDDILPTQPGSGDSTPWGFYWSSAGEGGTSTQGDASYLYISDYPIAHWCATTICKPDLWQLYTIKDNTFKEDYENMKGAVEYSIEAALKWSQEQWDKLQEWAKKTGEKIVVYSINTFESAQEAGAFVTDKLGNAVWEFAEDSYGVLKLFINSESVISAEMTVPVGANSMRFSFEFLLADEKTILEAFIEDVPVFLAKSEEYLGKGMQDSEWIDVSAFAGQEITVSFRLSNSVDGKQGVVAIDDIMFAKVIPYSDDEIELKSGWNLISLYKQPLTTSIENVLYSVSAGEFKNVWAYIDGVWKVYDPEYPALSDLSEMEAGLGYYINMNQAGTLTCYLIEPSNSVDLDVGWNLVGYNDESTQPIATALSSIDGKYELVWAFIDGQWDVYNPTNPGFSDLDTMERGYGYWIKTKQNCTWTLP
jgi:uncharacterized repeat protein (TIGR01451 family)